MISGVGIDIIGIKRIEDAARRFGKKFFNRIYTDKEILYCLSNNPPFEKLAGRFAAKEAVLKALGTGWEQNVSFKSVEILNDNRSRPVVYLHDKAAEIASELISYKISVSITHDEGFAAAIALIEKTYV